MHVGGPSLKGKKSEQSLSTQLAHDKHVVKSSTESENEKKPYSRIYQIIFDGFETLKQRMKQIFRDVLTR